MSKESVAKEIWNAVKSVGGTDEVAAGLIGNAEQESNINPKANGWAYGLFQFEFGTSEYTNFISYCNKKGYKPDTSKAQLNYLFVDGSGKIGYAEHLFNVSPRNGTVGHYDFNGGAQWGYSPHISWKNYLKLTDIEKATKIWELIYEAASIPRMENRIKYAKQWYSKFKGSYKGSTLGTVDSGKPAYNFKTYNLTDHEIQQLAFVATREQGDDVDGARAELSLIANLFEERGSSYGSITKYVLNSGWFASESTGNTRAEKKWTDIVVDVLVKGHRTLPPQINEHDSKGDLGSISTGDKMKNSDYKQFTTICYQNSNIPGGGGWTFYCFPQNNKHKWSDPFGTTKPKALKEWLEKYASKGQFYWDSDKIHFEVGESPFTGVSGGYGLVVHADKLYSSQNYEYINVVRETETKFEKNIKKTFIAHIKDILKKQSDNSETDSGKNGLVNNLKDYTINFVELNDLLKPVSNEVATRVSGTTATSVLPVIKTLVEAPFFKVDINGVVFGGYNNNQVPNYVRSITVNKVNGSLNEYNIQLIHQIRPGDNPNYIDEVLSSVKYGIIKITYGNANTGQKFSDNKALITDVSQHFDFTNCNITYNINAISLAATVAAAKHTFPEYTGKVSSKITDLLWGDNSSDLLKLFPGMKDRAAVIKEGLIPTNDKVITISKVENITTLGYLNLLIDRMESSSNSNRNELNNSIYMISISDDGNGGKFKISEIKNLNSTVKNVPFMYEVNIGYPDENYVLNFDINTNFAWSIAYEGAKKVKKYDYEINQYGEVEIKAIPSYYKNEKDELGNRNLWTSLTRYPIDATLTVRGLTQDSLLMQYIKINSYVYGAKRITSGVYIVTGQQDNIGNGIYTTTLQLMRVTGDDEYINLDGRKRI